MPAASTEARSPTIVLSECGRNETSRHSRQLRQQASCLSQDRTFVVPGARDQRPVLRGDYAGGAIAEPPACSSATSRRQSTNAKVARGGVAERESSMPKAVPITGRKGTV